MSKQVITPLESITEALRSKHNAKLHARLGVKPYVFKVREVGKQQVVRIRALAANVELARNKVLQLMPKAAEVTVADF
jgi:hypothetical protein